MLTMAGCGATGLQGGGDSTTLESGSADGSGNSAVASDTDTSVTVTPTSGSAWSEFLIDLGAQFTKANICAGKTIFGRLGTAMCPEEISAGNAFRSIGNLTLKGELASGTCSDTAYASRVTCEKADTGNVWTPVVATAAGEKIANTQLDTTDKAVSRDLATFSYDGSAWAQTAIAAGLVCGASGNIEARIGACNRQWRASVGSKDGGGTWSLVSRQDNYEVWRDDKTGLIWSDNMGGATQCAAAGDNEASGWCDSNVAIIESVCAETGFAGAAITSIRGLNAGVYDARKGAMGLSSTNRVLWRLPTLKDYTTAYGNGMAYVLPRLGSFWTASVDHSVAAYAMYFSVFSSGYVEVGSGVRASASGLVRCVGR